MHSYNLSKSSKDSTRCQRHTHPLMKIGEQQTHSIAPDGGWGWMVVLGSFCANMITDSLNYSFGLFLPEIQETYGTTQGLAALVGSLFASLQLIVGPLASSFINKFGSRVAMSTGAVLCSVGFIVCIWMNTITGLLLTYGVVAGVSCSLISVPTIVHVAYYFETKRALATGISTAGSGFGLFALAPVMVYLIDQYTWKGALWFISGAFLNCAVCASLLRPIRISDSPPQLDSDIHEKPQSRVIPPQNAVHPRSLEMPTIFVVQDANLASSEMNDTEQSLDPRPPRFKRVGSVGRHIAKKSTALTSGVSHRKKSQSICADRQDIFFSGSLSLLNESTYINSYHKTRDTAIDQPTFLDKLSAFVKPAIDLKLLCRPVMIVVCLFNFLNKAGFFIPLYYLNIRAESFGVPAQEASFLLSIQGIAHIVGLLVFGLMADRKWVSALAIQNAAMIACGCVTMAVPWFTSYISMAIYAAVFGFLLASSRCLASIILVDTIGLQKLTNAFGLMILCRGIAAMAGPPIAGSLYDLSGSYDAPFYFGGILIVASGVVGLTVPLANRFSDIRQITHYITMNVKCLF